jgi:tropinone reductase I
MKQWNLKGKKALITGGTKGIGLAIVEEFASLGAELFLMARSKDDVTALVNKLKENGHKADGISGDLSDASFRKQLVEAVSSRWSSMDILVNNVGTNIRKRFVDYTEEEQRKVFETNLFTTVEISRLSFPLLKASGKASVINMASIAGSMDVTTGAPYGMTKCGWWDVHQGVVRCYVLGSMC